MADNISQTYSDGSSTTRYATLSWFPADGRSTANVTPPAINRYKCVKYADIYNKWVRVPWYVKISEDIWTGTLKARNIELFYAYKTSSTSSEVTVSCGKWTASSNIDGSASSLHFFEANPYLLYNGSVYSSRLVIRCGDANVNQTWKWRLRTKTGPTSGTWGSWTQQSNDAVNCWAYPSGDFLSAMKNYNGVEFLAD